MRDLLAESFRGDERPSFPRNYYPQTDEDKLLSGRSARSATEPLSPNNYVKTECRRIADAKILEEEAF
jgi:hypothetical protein